MTKRTRRILYGARRRADSTDPGAERASTFGAELGADGAFPGVSASSVGADGALHGADGAARDAAEPDAAERSDDRVAERGALHGAGGAALGAGGALLFDPSFLI